MIIFAAGGELEPEEAAAVFLTIIALWSVFSWFFWAIFNCAGIFYFNIRKSAKLSGEKLAPAKEREKAFKKDAGFAAFLALYLTVLSLLIPLSLSLCISDIDGLLGIAVIAATCFALAVLLWMLLKAAALCCMRPSQKSKEAAVCLAELSAANPELSEKLKIAQEQLAHRNELAEIFEKRMNSPLLFFMIIFGISLIAAGFVLTLFRVY